MFAVNAVASFHKGSGGFVVNGGQRADVADELVQQGGLDQVCFLWNQRLLRQHNLFCGHRVSGQQAPVDVAAITQVRVIRVLRRWRKNNSVNGEETWHWQPDAELLLRFDTYLSSACECNIYDGMDVYWCWWTTMPNVVYNEHKHASVYHYKQIQINKSLNKCICAIFSY